MFQKLKPARQQSQIHPTNVKIVCDFDGLVNQSVGFKFNGKTYILHPVDVDNFMRLTLAYNQLLQMIEGRSQGQSMTADEVYQRYFDMIHPLVPDFYFEELKQLNLIQLNNLVNLCFRQIAGDPSLYEKKNSLNP